MSSAFDVNIVSVNIGALSNDKYPIFKVPTGFGGITVVGGHIQSHSAGTSNFNVIDMGTAGTSSEGTVLALGSSVFVADTPKDLTVSTAFVDEGHYVGVEELNVGALNAVTIVSVAYICGY